jgi:hypothetical protein
MTVSAMRDSGQWSRTSPVQVSTDRARGTVGQVSPTKSDMTSAWPPRRLCNHSLVPSQPSLHFTSGLPGVGKTTLARRPAVQHRALLLNPDEWMAPLFGESDPSGGKGDILGDGSSGLRMRFSTRVAQ